MNKFSILDCTLRDGGYINDWNFGQKAIKRITNYLEDSGIDIIECGFLEDKEYDINTSVFSDINQITPFITPKRPNTLYVAMIAIGDIDPDKIPEYDGTSIDGIRITFHKDEWEEEREAAIKLMKKGYKVFVQPVGTTTYTDIELVELVQKVNELNPYAFYIVDTMGTMYPKDLLRIFQIIEKNLFVGIKIGFHSHNNLQMSFANAQELLKLNTKHHIIIDSSVFGMGRGVGNLATELVTQYINDNIETRYRVTPLLCIVDDYLNKIYNDTPWGYSVPYYIAATNETHPNYATYLMNKQTINIEKISKIINEISVDKRALYDEKYIEKIYLKFQENQIDDRHAISKIGKIVEEKDILILAPGQSLTTHQNEIKQHIKDNNSLVITINFDSKVYNQDLIFISNMKRFSCMDELENKKVILTSNIEANDDTNGMMINYSSLLGEGREADNAGVMLMNLLIKLGVKSVSIAGFDGFQMSSQNNYFSQEMTHSIDRQAILQKNEDINRQLIYLCEKLNVNFITPTEYTVGKQNRREV